MIGNIVLKIVSRSLLLAAIKTQVAMVDKKKVRGLSKRSPKQTSSQQGNVLLAMVGALLVAVFGKQGPTQKRNY